MMKLIFTILVFCAGFATAIYMTTPATAQADDCQAQITHEPVISAQTAQKINVGMIKCVDISKDAAKSASEYIKNKLKENQQ